jgi:hypothetical protein
MATKPIEEAVDRQQTIAAFGDHVSSGKVQFFAAVGVDFIPDRVKAYTCGMPSGRVPILALRPEMLIWPILVVLPRVRHG